MSERSLRADFHKAVVEENNSEIHEALLNYSTWFEYPCNLDLVKFLLYSVASTCDNKKITEVLDNFQKFFSFKNINKIFFDPASLEKYLGNAVNNGNVLLAEFLLNNDVKYKGLNNLNYNIIYRSNIDTRKDMLLLLLRYDQLNVKFRNEKNQNLLNVFIYRHVQENDEDAVEIAKILIDSGVSIDEPDDDGITPLINSIHINHRQLIKFLIKNGANVNHTDYLQRSPLSIAIDKQNTLLIDLLKSSGADINVRSENWWTALHRACKRYDEEKIRLYLSEGADVTIEDIYGRTPFYLLVEKGESTANIGCINVMLREFANLIYSKKSISQKDKNCIQKHLPFKLNFDLAYVELEKKASIEFYESYSYYSILQMSKQIKKLADIVKNDEFVSKFKENLDMFNYFKDDLQKILSRAILVRDELDSVQSRLDLEICNSGEN